MNKKMAIIKLETLKEMLIRDIQSAEKIAELMGENRNLIASYAYKDKAADQKIYLSWVKESLSAING